LTNSKNQRFKEDYDRLVQPIFKFIYYKCGDREEARDLAQEVFVKYWEKLDAVDEQGASSYIYMIARNLLANKFQKDKVKLKFVRSLSVEDDREDPQFLLEVEDHKVRLERTLSDMPDTQREVLLMHRIEGIKYREIAEKLDISVKAVEKRMSLALVKIKSLNKSED